MSIPNWLKNSIEQVSKEIKADAEVKVDAKKLEEAKAESGSGSGSGSGTAPAEVSEQSGSEPWAS